MFLVLPIAFTCLSLVYLSAAQAGNVITVAVGQNGLTFTPSSFKAPVGSIVQFQFYPRNHSVVQGSFDNPCQPSGPDAFYSGYQIVASGTAPEVFEVTINDTNPIFFYCSQPFATHCKNGMVGVINPSEAGDPSQSLNEYTAAAGNTNSSSTPAQVQGGVFRPVLSSSSSSSSATSRSTATGLASPSSSATMPSQMISGTGLDVGMSMPSASATSTSTSTVGYGGPNACPAAKVKK
ncbi:MAG: hypothetical protein M1820_010574 [Bogoriella megaspora]|nr:MAG: hypothetical protein M1820_010574 [Bogoriella megaspora]